MKPNITATVNKLIAFARDNLMLDALDETYTFNRLATLAGIESPAQADVDYGDATPDELLDELRAAKPDIDVSAVTDALMPPAHTVDYYFTDELGRKPKKAFDFIFDLYALGGYALNSEAHYSDGYLHYAAIAEKPERPVFLPVPDQLKYTPRVVGGHIATLRGDDILSADITARECAYVEAYGGAIARRIGSENNAYYCCDSIAPASAEIKEQLAAGAVKIALLDYPVPVLAFSGIAKNTVAATAARVIKTAADGGIPCVVAATAKDGVTFYAIFAGNVESDGLIRGDDVLSACGVFATTDFSPLVPVLEKGTGLSTDLFAFKPIYDMIGGVKHGQKAREALDGAVVSLFKLALAKAASVTEDQAKALAEAK